MSFICFFLIVPGVACLWRWLVVVRNRKRYADCKSRFDYEMRQRDYEGAAFWVDEKLRLEKQLKMPSKKR